MDSKLYCSECGDVVSVGTSLQDCIDKANSQKYGARHKCGEAAHVFVCFDCRENEENADDEG